MNLNSTQRESHYEAPTRTARSVSAALDPEPDAAGDVSGRDAAESVADGDGAYRKIVLTEPVTGAPEPPTEPPTKPPMKNHRIGETTETTETTESVKPPTGAPPKPPMKVTVRSDRAATAEVTAPVSALGQSEVTDFGYSLPGISGCKWEKKPTPFRYELWQWQGQRRVTGGYICRIGKRQLEKWQSSGTSQPQIDAEVEALAAEKLAAKVSG